MKRQASDQEKIFANHISDIELYPEYRQNSKNSEVNKQPNEKWAKISTDTLQKTKYEWQISTWKDAKLYQPLVKCKLKPQ